MNITVPLASLGNHTIIASGKTSQKVAVSTIQVLPAATLSQKSGISGSSVTLTGYGFAGYIQDNNETVNVYWGSQTGPLLGSSPTDGNGTTGPISLTIPAGPGGTYTLYAIGQASGAIATVKYKVLPTLTITPSSGARGSQATVSGSSFGANEIVAVKWNCNKSSCTSKTILATVTTDANGNFSTVITIPKNASVGTTYAVGALGKTSKSFAFTSYQVTS